MDDDRPVSTSLCAIFAEIIEEQLHSTDPDMDAVFEQLANIKQNCSLMPTAAGETPEHLEDFQFETLDDDAEGTVVVGGQKVPKTAAKRMD